MTSSEKRLLLPFLREIAAGAHGCGSRACLKASGLLERFDRKPSLKTREARKSKKESKAMERRAHGKETARIRAAVFLRDGGCAVRGPSQFDCKGRHEMDHFFGRGLVPQAIDNCWELCALHHRHKTENYPTRAWWDAQWIGHCEAYGYAFAPRPDTRRTLSGEISSPESKP